MVKLRPEILVHPHVSDEIKAYNNSLETLRKENKLKLGKAFRSLLMTGVGGR